MKSYRDLIAEVTPQIRELFPWDLQEKLADNPILLDIREPDEFASMHIAGSINVPRGILEQSCEWDYEETVPRLVKARNETVVVVCRSGYRSALAAYTMQLLGYKQVYSLKTGLKGWSDFEQMLVDKAGAAVDQAESDQYFTSKVRENQKKPKV